MPSADLVSRVYTIGSAYQPECAFLSIELLMFRSQSLVRDHASTTLHKHYHDSDGSDRPLPSISQNLGRRYRNCWGSIECGVSLWCPYLLPLTLKRWKRGSAGPCVTCQEQRSAASDCRQHARFCDRIDLDHLVHLS